MNDLITVHPLLSRDPEIRLQAQFDYARQQLTAASQRYMQARDALADFRKTQGVEEDYRETREQGIA